MEAEATSTPLSALVAALRDRGGLERDRLELLAEAWRTRHTEPLGTSLGPRVAAAAGAVETALRTQLRTTLGARRLVASASPSEAMLALTWARAAAGDAALSLLPLFDGAVAEASAAAESAAWARFEHGPAPEALASLRWAGPYAAQVATPGPSRARFELLVHHAARSGASVPELGAWLWSDREAFRLLATSVPLAAMRYRSFAAELLAAAADGFPEDLPDAHPWRGQTVRMLAALATHPEAAVWIPGARALGRIAPHTAQADALIRTWLSGSHNSLRRRALTADASSPAGTHRQVHARIDDLLASGDGWTVAALGPAVPHLQSEARPVWERLHAWFSGPGGHVVEAVWGFVQGLSMARRADTLDESGRTFLEETRRRALDATGRGAREARLWSAIRADTDWLDGLSASALDPRLQLEELAARAVRSDPSRLRSHVTLMARSIPLAFQTALTALAGPAGASDTQSDRGSHLHCLLSCAEALARQLFAPMLEVAGAEQDPLRSELAAAAERMGAAVREACRTDKPDFDLHSALLACLGLLCDAATDGDADDAASWRAKQVGAHTRVFMESTWLAQPTKRDAARFRRPLSALTWRVLDIAGAPRLPPHQPGAIARASGWLALAAGGSAWIAYVQRSAGLSGGSPAGAARADVEALQAEFSTTGPHRDPASVLGAVAPRLDALQLGATNLDSAVAELLTLLSTITVTPASTGAAPRQQPLTALASVKAELSLYLERPDLALASDRVIDAPAPDLALVSETLALFAGRSCDIAALGARWARGAGPVIGPYVAACVRQWLGPLGHVAPTTILPALGAFIGRYRLVQMIASDGMGEIWLACNDAPRDFALKRPKVDAGASAGDKAALQRALAREAEVLKKIHHVNVAAFIDSGWDPEQGPYLVLEYLVGSDLGKYAKVRPLDLHECKPIVRDIGRGLEVFHRSGNVHLDMKPGNIFLRLHLPPDAATPRDSGFQTAHRDPSIAPVLNAVLIDFGTTRASALASASKHVAGTMGYMAPEQVRGAANLGPGTDLYGLAAAVFTALTGRAFFDTFQESQDRYFAHALCAPLAHQRMSHALCTEAIATRHKAWVDAADNMVKNAVGEQRTGAVLGLLREATDLDTAKRPSIAEFVRRFDAL